MNENEAKRNRDKEVALLKISTGLTPEHELGEKHVLRQK